MQNSSTYSQISYDIYVANIKLLSSLDDWEQYLLLELKNNNLTQITI